MKRTDFIEGALRLAVFWIGFTVGPGFGAAVFYVSPDGKDANDGRDPHRAWRTVAKVNASRFAAGDRILFACGGEWRESLMASSSGAPGAPILYGAYGAGAKPKFWGSDVLKNADFQPADGGVYQLPLRARVAAVLVDHRFLAAVEGAEGVKKPDAWFWDGARLFINAGGKDPRTDGRTYTACVRVDCIHSNGQSHLLFRGLVSDESADAKDGYGFRVMGGGDVRLEDCEAYRAGRHHFGVINSTEFVGQGLRCAYALPNIPGGATFYVSFSDASRSGDKHQWIDCSAEHFENPEHANYQIFYDHGEGLGPILIRNMISHGGKLSVGSSAEAPVTIRGGLIEDASLEVFGAHARVDGLTIRGNGAVDLWGSECLFQNLQLVGVKPVKGGPTGYGSAVVLRDGAKKNTFRFCTIVMESGESGTPAGLAIVGDKSATEWYGNILVGASVAAKKWTGGLDASDLSLADFNFYSDDAVFQDAKNTQMNLKQWKSRGFDVHSLSGDPMFVNAAKGDYSLRPGSRARGAAALEAARTPEIDFSGKARAAGASDLGAHQTAASKVERP